MTKGLRAFANSSLRTMLSKAAAAPLSGAFWGAFMTLLGQSSSATTMTTIGLVSAGLLTFPQGLGLVFSSRVGPGFRRKRRHPGTGWLVALVGVLLGGGRIAARGGRARRFCACALRTDDSATGHGRARRELASLGPTGRPSCARSRLGIRRVRPQDTGCGWARDDRSDAVVDGIHRCHPFGLLHRRDRSGPGLRPDHRAEDRNGDQFRKSRRWARVPQPRD